MMSIRYTAFAVRAGADWHTIPFPFLKNLTQMMSSLLASLSNVLPGNRVVLLGLIFGVYIPLHGQINNNGCVGGNFGIDAGLYSNIIEYGTGTPAAGSRDWFYSSANGGAGLGIIDESDPGTIQALLQGGGNPIYERRMNTGLASIVSGQIMIDAIFARDYFGGTGGIDQTTYETASKNGEDPAIWDPGPMNVLGKNDLIDVAGHMFRNGTQPASDLWFVGLINRAEPGGSAYMDFEFYVEEVQYSPGTGFTSGGPNLGHTAFKFDASGNITSIGDLIFNVALENGGTEVNVQMRIWVSYADYISGNSPPGFSWGPEYDGAFTGSPYGYASIIPNITEICGYVNRENENPLAPPWGTLNTKYHVWGTTYADFSVAEVGVNLTALGLDHASLAGTDPCFFPLNTFIVKTRASASFTAQLKDFAGPYKWGAPDVTPEILGDPVLSCLNPTTLLEADNKRVDITYDWWTEDGNILTDPTYWEITVDQPGTYYLQITYPTGCSGPAIPIEVYYDPTKPFFNTPTYTSMVSCNGNDGSIDLTVTGATQPYTFMWSNGATTEDLSGLAPGTYDVTVTDFWGCTVTTSATVAARIPTAIVEGIVDASCFGYNDGSISLSVSGQSPFTYMWSNGNLTATLSNLEAGTYTVTVTDADGCTTVAAYVVDEPDAITATISKTDDTDPDPGVGNGTITLSGITGGTPTYMFSWTGPDGFTSTDQNLTGLKYGEYTVTITDQNGCTYVTSAFIFEPEICDDGIDNDGDGLTNCDDPDCEPDPADPITTNNSAPCVGETGVTYTVTNDPLVTQYIWTVPANATIVSGQGTNQIEVLWNTTQSGDVCVRVDIVGCVSDPVCITVTPNDVPPQPDIIIIENN
jgi:hypothetical protein